MEYPRPDRYQLLPSYWILLLPGRVSGLLLLFRAPARLISLVASYCFRFLISFVSTLDRTKEYRGAPTAWSVPAFVFLMNFIASRMCERISFFMLRAPARLIPPTALYCFRVLISFISALDRIKGYRWRVHAIFCLANEFLLFSRLYRADLHACLGNKMACSAKCSERFRFCSGFSQPSLDA